MRTALLRVSMLLSIVSPIVVHSQSQPPAVMVIGREEIKPGKGAAHAQWEAGWPAAFAKANYPTTYLAMTSMSGPHEAWFLVGFPSWEAMEKDNARMASDPVLSAEDQRLSAGDGEFLSGSSSMIAINMPALTYGGPVDLPKMRYFEVITYRMRPGHEADFPKAATMVKNAYARAKIDRPWAVYRIASGAPAGTYIVMLPMRSLAVMDNGDKEDAAIGQALGADAATLDKMAADGIMSTTSQIMSFSPRMSYMSAAFKAGDPSFWK